MNHKIMLIEDDFTMRSLLRTLLNYEGYDVAVVENDTNSDAILDSIRQEEPVLILMDVHLRQLNGIELLEAIRSSATLSSTAVIMSSGSDMRERCLEQGADAFILKPYMPEDLIQQINQVIVARQGSAES